MEEPILPPGQSVKPTAVPISSHVAATNAPVSSFSAAPQTYPIESLEVHQEGEATVAPTYAPTMLSVPFSRRKATIVSLIITIVVILLTGLVSAFFVRRSAERPASQLDVPTQDASLEGVIESDLPPELQGLEDTLLVNGDVVTRGQLRVVSGLFTSTIGSAALTDNQTITLPNLSGEVCLNANNCNFATQAQLAEVQPIGGVTALNDLAGNVTIQGSLNQVAVATGDGVITLSTPQALDANANVQFGSLTLGGFGAATGVLISDGGAPVALATAGGAGQCLLSTAGAPSFQACPGGGGVSSLNSLTGALTLQGTANQINVASGGTTITLSTPQDIAVASSPTFAGLTSPSLQSSGMLTLTSSAGGDIILNSADTIELQDNTNVTGVLNVSGNADIAGVLAVGNNASPLPVAAAALGHIFTGTNCGTFGCYGFFSNPVASSVTGTNTGIAGVYSRVDVSAGSLDRAAAFSAANSTGAGTLVDNYGLFVENMTKGTNDYGIYIQGADTYALFVDAGATRLDGTLELQTLGTTDTAAYLCRNSSNQLAACSGSGAGAAFVQGGNDFGGATIGTLGTINGGDLNVITSNTTRLTVQADGDIAFDTNTLFVDAANNHVYVGDISGSFGIELDGTDVDFEDMPSLTFGPNSNKPWTFVVGGAGNDFDVFGEGNRIATFGLGGNFWVCCNDDAQDPRLAAANVEATPGFTFSNDTDTGMYWVNTNQLGFSTGGTNRLILSSTGGTFANNVAVNGGSLTSTASTLNIDAGSTIALQDTTTLPNGLVGTPALSFASDTNTGLYRVAADQLGISTGGANQVTVGVDPAAAAFATGVLRINTIDSPATGDFEIFGAGSEDLDIGSNSGMSLNINQVNSGGTFSIFSDADELLSINSNGDITTRSSTVTFIRGYLRLGFSNFTPAGTEELIPDSSLVEVTCSNGGGCTPTLDEDFSSRGQTLRIVNVGANTVTINNVSGSVELAGSAAWVGSQWSSLSLVYVTDDGLGGRWVELARSEH